MIKDTQELLVSCVFYCTEAYIWGFWADSYRACKTSLWVRYAIPENSQITFPDSVLDLLKMNLFGESNGRTEEIPSFDT